MGVFWLLGAGACALFIATTRALAQRITCDDLQKLMLEIELIFSRNIGGKVGVTEEQWTELVAGEITPQFPDELSVDDALGQVLNASFNLRSS
jgi:hypothetical protein